MTRVAVSIVNWNTAAELRGCLAALAAAEPGLALEVWVVDNASDDDSAAMVRREFPHVRLLAMDANVGFAAANNEVLGRTRADHVLVLNPDVRITPAAILELTRALERSPAAAVAPLLVGSDDRPHTHLYRRFPRLLQILLFWTVARALAGRVPALRRRWLEHAIAAREYVPVDQLPGAAMLVRRAAVEAIGPMDPGYFMWFEDVDWCLRARAAGMPLYVCPRVVARHEGGVSFRSWKLERRVQQFYSAFGRFACKHDPRLARRALPLLRFDLWLSDAVLALAARLLLRRSARLHPFRETRAALRRLEGFAARGAVPSFAVPGRPRPDPGVPAAAGERPATTPHVDVVVVNWNGRRFLPECLAALRRQTHPVRVTVVDNASDDGSLDYLRSQRSVRLVALAQNRGYAAAANEGLRRGDAAFVLVMNPDVLLEPDHVGRLWALLAASPSVGAAQGRLQRVAAEAFAAAPPAERILDSAGVAIRRSRYAVDRGQGEPYGGAYAVPASVFGATGAALFLRRAMLDDVAVDGEVFDEAFFAYKEDVDLCWRARLLGWDVRYEPAAVGWHVRGWPGRGRPLVPSPAARRHSWKNHYLLLLKNDRGRDLVRALPWAFGWELVRLGHALLRDRHVLRAYGDLWRVLPRVRHQRRQLAARRRAAPREIRGWFGRSARLLEPAGAAAGARVAAGAAAEAAG